MIRLISTIILLMIFTGCSSKVFLPYEENQLCKRGLNEGVCGSVSQVYKESFKMKGNNDAK